MTQDAKAKSAAYLAGRKAAEAGTPLSDNPHGRKVSLREKWRLGWMDGADDDQRAEAKAWEAGQRQHGGVGISVWDHATSAPGADTICPKGHEGRVQSYEVEPWDGGGGRAIQHRCRACRKEWRKEMGAGPDATQLAYLKEQGHG